LPPHRSRAESGLKISMQAVRVAIAGFIVPYMAVYAARPHAAGRHLVRHRLHRVQGEARIRGSGAGMEPPAGAVLENGVWRYRPALAPLARLRLANSAYTAGHELCFDGRCRPLAALAGGAENKPVDLYACP
jgi:hypothetical protein